ncbi:MAG: glycosyltransferase family 4 protein [Chloroflexota bacterium]|nr:glycosyltransferase family 4 protein [Chloroflexota bacterium]
MGRLISGRKRIVMITQDVEVTRRILQEAHSLMDAGYQVKIITRSASTRDSRGETAGIPIEYVAVRGRDKRFRWLYRLAGEARGTSAAALWSVLTMRHTFAMRVLPRAIREGADVYHSHDLNNLEVAWRASRSTGGKLVYDAHELFAEMANRWVRMRRGGWRRLEQRLLPQADLTFTVNELIAEEMARRYGVARPTVLLNCPEPPATFDSGAGYDLIREHLSLSPERKIVLYQGWMSEGRGLENLVRSAPLLSAGAVVVFMGYGEYQGKLERLVSEVGGGRVAFIPAVTQRELLAYCASADVGVIPYQAVDLNNYYTSPNKLFDFIQAALPVVASDLPFLRKVIVEHGIGVVARLDSPESYARAINGVLDRPDAGTDLREHARSAARYFTWSAQAEKLVSSYHDMLAGS